VHDVLYAELSRRKRRSLHRKYVEQLEKRHRGRLERIYPQLVYHYSQGDVPEKTVEYALLLANASLDAYSAEEAARAVKTALEFLDEEWEGDKFVEGEARMLLARAHRMSGDIDGALKESEAAIKIFEREKQSALFVRALLLAAETAWQARRTEDTVKWIERGTNAARAAEETESLRQLLALAATLANLRGEYEKANGHLEEAARLGAASKEADPEEETPAGGKLVVGLVNPVNTLEPATHELIEEGEILTNVFETLLAIDEKGNLVPSLCEKWEVGDEGRSFSLTLRGDARFQDNQPLTAQEVKKSFERAVNLFSGEMPSAFAAIRGARAFAEKTATDIEGIVVHSDHKVEFQLLESLPVYPALLTDHHTAIARQSPENKEARVYGTGPFRIAAQERERILLEQHAGYWRSVPAKLDAIEFRPRLSARAIASGVRSGEFDLARDLLPQDLDEILRDARFRRGLVEVPMKNSYFIAFNSRTSEVMQNQTTRRALAGVVRTHDLVWQTLGRFAQPTACLIPPGMLGHDPGRRPRLLALEEAIEMLRSSHAAQTINLKAAVHPILQDRYASLLTRLFSIWEELGVKVSIETPDMASYLEAQDNAAKLDLLIGRWAADYNDPDDFTYTLFHSRVGLYRNYTSSTEGDQILEEARAESRPKIRESLYRKFEHLVLEAGVVVPLFHDINYRIAGPKVRNLKLQSSPPYVNYATLGKVESSVAATETHRTTGGTIQVPISGTIESLDPALANTIELGEILPSIFETLTQQAEGGRIVPRLAAEITTEEGGRKYRFRLRDDVRFHDGRRLTARDVRYSFERLLQSRDSDGRYLFSAIRGADRLLSNEASDLAGFQIQSLSEFTIELIEPVSFFPALLAFAGAAILPEGSDPATGKSWQEGCVGTGAFRVVRFDANRMVELERNQIYWRKGYPKSERLVFNLGVSAREILAEFRAGRFSLAADLSPADVETLLREPDFAAHYRETPSLITYYAAFNTHRGAFSDKNLRLRLARSVDVAAMVRNSLGRLATPASGLIPPGLLGHVGHDGTAAARISRTDNSPTSATIEQVPTQIEVGAMFHPILLKEYSSVTRELEQAFGNEGVKIRAMNTTFAEFMGRETQSKSDVWVGRWLADYPDANSFVHILHSQEGTLGKLCGAPEIDRLIDRGRAETNPSARHALYRQIEEIIARDAILIPLFHEQSYRFARPEVEGLSVSYWAPAVQYESLRIRD
jgi:peptide/nickel transport system substrate-binding protein/oligopeptide transport system substrate-binding protein